MEIATFNSIVRTLCDVHCATVLKMYILRENVLLHGRLTKETVSIHKCYCKQFQNKLISPNVKIGRKSRADQLLYADKLAL